MKYESGSDRSRAGHMHKPGDVPKPAAPAIFQLGQMSHAELMALAQKHNRQLGLDGDVLAPVMAGVAETAKVRPPAVHPFTVGGAPRKDQYQTAWKALSKRIGAALMGPATEAAQPSPPRGVATATAAPAAAAAGVAAAGAGRAGRQTSVSATAPPAGAAEVPKAPPPTRAEMYGTGERQTPQALQFSEVLAEWLALGPGPIDLPLLAPGAPPVPLRRLFLELRDAGGADPGRTQQAAAPAAAPAAGGDGDGGAESKTPHVGADEAGGSHAKDGGQAAVAGSDGGGGGGSVCWSSLAARLQGDPGLGELLRQVYDAYLLPLEQRMPAGTRPAQVEAWMAEDVRRRAALEAERVAPSAEQVVARLQTASKALVALAQQQQQQRPVISPVAAPVAVAAAGDSTGPCGAAPAACAAAGHGDAGKALVSRSAAAAAAAAGTQAGGDGAADALAVAAAPIAGQVMWALRVAAVAAPSLLAGPSAPVSGGKRSRTAGRGARRGSAGIGAGSRKRARGAAAQVPYEAGAEGTAGGSAPSADRAARADGTDAKGAGSGGGTEEDLRDPKTAALLSVVASLRELRAGPPGCTLRPPPDLRTNFLNRWEAVHAERSAAAAAAAAAEAEAVAAVTAATAPCGGGWVSMAGGTSGTSGGDEAARSDAQVGGRRPKQHHHHHYHPPKQRDRGPPGAGEGSGGSQKDRVIKKDNQPQPQPSRSQEPAPDSHQREALPPHPNPHPQVKREAPSDEGPAARTAVQGQLPPGAEEAPDSAAAAQPRRSQQQSLQGGQPAKREDGRPPRKPKSGPSSQPSQRPSRPPKRHLPEASEDSGRGGGSRGRERPPSDSRQRPASQYPPQPPQYRRNSSPAAVPLMSAAAPSSYDPRAPPPPPRMPPPPPGRDPAHWSPPVPVPRAVQQHLETMRRQSRFRSYSTFDGGDDGGCDGSGGDLYGRPGAGWDREPYDARPREGLASAWRGPLEPGGGLDAQQQPHPPLHAPVPRGGGPGTWCEGRGQAGAQDGGWEYGSQPPPPPPHVHPQPQPQPRPHYPPQPHNARSAR